MSPEPPLTPVCVGLESGLETCPEQLPASQLPAPGAVHSLLAAAPRNQMSWKLVSRLRGLGGRVESCPLHPYYKCCPPVPEFPLAPSTPGKGSRKAVCLVVAGAFGFASAQPGMMGGSV